MSVDTQSVVSIADKDIIKDVFNLAITHQLKLQNKSDEIIQSVIDLSSTAIEASIDMGVESVIDSIPSQINEISGISLNFDDNMKIIGKSLKKNGYSTKPAE